MKHVVLVEPEIHWNSGNAGRTCLAAGAQLHLVRPLGFSLSDREVRRSGLDYWQHVDPRVWSSWSELSTNLTTLGTPWLFSTRGTRSLYDVDLSGDAALIFGSETKGLAAEIVQAYPQHLLRIPMVSPHIRSLNLSSAVAIALYEALRQDTARR